MNDTSFYRVYLLRLWQEDDGRDAGDGPAPLRILLEDPNSGHRQVFSDLEALTHFLANQLEQET